MEGDSGHFALEAGYAALSDALDARAVLRYLNQLGIRNVSGAALRDFITDLKKLIKHDLQCKSKTVEEVCTEVQGPERLHSASTFCSRTRSRRASVSEQPKVGCGRECRKGRQNSPLKGVKSAPNLRPVTSAAPARRSCSCTRVDQPEKKKPEAPKKPALTSSSNLIKVPIALPQKKADPVSLYHYYLALWDKYKSNVPGENSWAELRWSIRQKLAGDIQKPVLKKTTAPTAKELEKRREGWVE